ncbi:predicted protein [Sclerotinia sclerotiorum 1980 UF-70]|uniref:Uncharacterized protein n=1 Tax=Sclerotinia sclerotiorum (strain ATCC 18683 / 1980 / Ss-1) TaxID=665079 RepID=A7EDG2_SCLS1|nr:predicted protein [Sclerotinia sclerotiorum 1980 UF-70]EDO00878.1 predicted protein [Sclerotinia sclerotiorum 1980 UF-70]
MQINSTPQYQTKKAHETNQKWCNNHKIEKAERLWQLMAQIHKSISPDDFRIFMPRLHVIAC